MVMAISTLAALVFLFYIHLPCLCNDQNNCERAHSRYTRGREGGGVVKVDA